MGFLDFFKIRKPKETVDDISASSIITLDMVNVFWRKFQNQLPNLLKLQASHAVEKSNALLSQLFPHVKMEFELDEARGDYSKIVFTAEGQVKEFQTVMQLVQHAPVIHHTDVIAFRQRLALDLAQVELAMQNIKLACGDLLIRAIPVKGRINLAVAFNKPIKPDELQLAKQLACILLDHVLGEYDFAVKVGAVDFIEPAVSKGFIPLTQFVTVFDSMWHNDLGHTQLFPNDEIQLKVFEINDHETHQVVALGQLNQLAKAITCRADFGVRLDVIIQIPDKSVLEIVYDYEDELTHNWQTQQTGIFALSLLLFIEGSRISTWYVADERQAIKLAQQLTHKYSSLSISIETHYDPLWDSYLTWC